MNCGVIFLGFSEHLLLASKLEKTKLENDLKKISVRKEGIASSTELSYSICAKILSESEKKSFQVTKIN
jgi:hypothetical protein